MPIRDQGSVTYSAAIESAAAPDTGAARSEFAERVLREATRRGFDRASRRVILGDCAPWIWIIAAELFPSVAQIADRRHVKRTSLRIHALTEHSQNCDHARKGIDYFQKTIGSECDMWNSTRRAFALPRESSRPVATWPSEHASNSLACTGQSAEQTRLSPYDAPRSADASRTSGNAAPFAARPHDRGIFHFSVVHPSAP